MSVKVSIFEGPLDTMQQRLQMMKKLKLRVGYQDEGGKQIHPDSEITVAKVAAIMEFGSDEIPERSFIRSTIRERQREISAEYERQISHVVAGDKEPVPAVAAVGKFVVDLIRKKIRGATAWAEPLDPATVEAKKGKSTPLDWTGTLAENLSYRVSIGRQTFARGS